MLGAFWCYLSSRGLGVQGSSFVSCCCGVSLAVSAPQGGRALGGCLVLVPSTKTSPGLLNMIGFRV